MPLDDDAHLAPLRSSHRHRVEPIASHDGADEVVTTSRPRLRIPFGCFP